MGIQDYHVLGLFGEGSFGKVYKGREKNSFQTVAMKFILKLGKTEDLHNFRHEIEDSLTNMRSARLVDVVSRALLVSRQMQIVLYNCLHNGLESCVNAILQAFLKIVNSYSALALSPTRKHVINELPLRIVLVVLGKCATILSLGVAFVLLTSSLHSLASRCVQTR